MNWWDMVYNNWQQIRKGTGDLSVQDLISLGGYLAEEDAKEIIVDLIEASPLLQKCTVKGVTSHKTNMPRVGVSDEWVLAPDDGQATPEADRRKADMGESELTAGRYKCVIRLEDEVEDYVVTPKQFRQKVLDLFVRKSRSNMERIGLLSDTTSGTPVLTKFDGIFKRIDTYTVDFGDATMDRDKLKAMVKALPDQYDSDKLEFLTSRKAEVDYHHEIGNRATELGDKGITDRRFKPSYDGIIVDRVPNFPNNIGTGSHCTYVLLGDPKDLVWGVRKEIKIEFQRDADAGVTIAVIRVQFGATVGNKKSWVKGENVKTV